MGFNFSGETYDGYGVDKQHEWIEQKGETCWAAILTNLKAVPGSLGAQAHRPRRPRVAPYCQDSVNVILPAGSSVATRTPWVTSSRGTPPLLTPEPSGAS